MRQAPGHPAGGRTGRTQPGGGTGADLERLAAHAPFVDASAAAAGVLERLRAELGFGWWAVLRNTGETTVVLSSHTAFPAATGEQLPWAQSLCRLVLHGHAPMISPDVQAVGSFRTAPLVRRWQVGAYVSVPLTLNGTSLFGTLCAVDPNPQPDQVSSRLPLVQLQARLLSTMLGAEAQLDGWRRRAERAEADALQDPLTGLVNRRGWQLLLDREEQRCRRYGTLASILMIDLDGLKTVNDQAGHGSGDALLQRAADVLREAFRSNDVVARLGGDEFAVLAVETDSHAVDGESSRLQDLLNRAGVAASIGAATRDPTGGLAQAWTRADTAMYHAKRHKPRPPG